jgi:ribose transport system permease protein
VALRAEGHALLLISHNLESVFELADRILVLRHGRKIADVETKETDTHSIISLLTSGTVQRAKSLGLGAREDLIVRNTSNDSSPAEADTYAAVDMAPSEITLSEVLLTRQAAMTVIAILLFIVFATEAPNFLSFSNLFDILRGTSFIGIVAVAWTYLLIAGELDLSVGSIYGLGTILMAWFVGAGIGPWTAGGIVLVFGIIIGLINGLITVYIGVRAFVVTLGMLSVLRGAGLAISGNFPFTYPRDIKSSLYAIGGGSLWTIPVQAIWLLGVVIVGAFVLSRTKFGCWVYATGGNEAAAREAGIPVKLIKLITFVLVGFACALIAVLQGAWLRSASPGTGIGFELQVIGAVLIGGASLAGGDGNVYGTVVGAAILGMVTNGLVLYGLPPASSLLASGAIIIVAGTIDVLLRRTGDRMTTRGSVFRKQTEGGSQ